jgi:putative oxidoreductase
MKIQSLLARLTPVQTAGQSLLLLLLRLVYGGQFMRTGYGKLMNLDRTTGFFESLHIPAPHFHAVLVGCTEMIGGTLLVLGLCTRLASIPLIISMCVAYATAERADAFKDLSSIWTAIDGITSVTPYQFLMACLMLLAFGPGKIALDALLKRHFDRCQCSGGCATDKPETPVKDAH